MSMNTHFSPYRKYHLTTMVVNSEANVSLKVVVNITPTTWPLLAPS